MFKNKGACVWVLEHFLHQNQHIHEPGFWATLSSFRLGPGPTWFFPACLRHWLQCLLFTAGLSGDCGLVATSLRRRLKSSFVRLSVANKSDRTGRAKSNLERPQLARSSDDPCVCLCVYADRTNISQNKTCTPLQLGRLKSRDLTTRH